MHPSIEQKREALLDLCPKHKVKRLDLFGSATGEGFDPATSDLDFLVEFEDLDPGAYADAFFGLLDGLKELFGRPVDLVAESSISNPYFRKSVESTRVSLYAS